MCLYSCCLIFGSYCCLLCFGWMYRILVPVETKCRHETMYAWLQLLQGVEQLGKLLFILCSNFFHISTKVNLVACKLESRDTGVYVSNALDMNAKHRKNILVTWGKSFLSVWILLFVSVCLGGEVGLKRTHESDHPSSRGQDHHRNI